MNHTCQPRVIEKLELENTSCQNFLALVFPHSANSNIKTAAEMAPSAQLLANVAQFHQIMEDIRYAKLDERQPQPKEYIRARRTIEMLKWRMAEAEEELAQRSGIWSKLVSLLFRNKNDQKLGTVVETLRREAETLREWMEASAERGGGE